MSELWTCRAFPGASVEGCEEQTRGGSRGRSEPPQGWGPEKLNGSPYRNRYCRACHAAELQRKAQRAARPRRGRPPTVGVTAKGEGRQINPRVTEAQHAKLVRLGAARGHDSVSETVRDLIDRARLPR